jgi:hypothetical protein
LTFLIGILGDVGAWLVEHLLLGRFFKPASPAQQAVDTETKMAQDVADAPDRAQTVKELDNGTF